MKITTIIVRVLFGLLLLFASVSYFLKLFPQPEVHGNMKVFNEGIMASGYIMDIVKVLELVCGLAFVSGFFVPLAAIVIFPISINIFFVHLLLAPEGLPVGVFVLAANLFLIFVNRAKYLPMLSVK